MGVSIIGVAFILPNQWWSKTSEICL